MDLETLLVSLYVLVDDWWQEKHPRVHADLVGRHRFPIARY